MSCLAGEFDVPGGETSPCDGSIEVEGIFTLPSETCGAQ